MISLVTGEQYASVLYNINAVYVYINSIRIMVICSLCFFAFPAEISYSNFNPPEVVSRYRDPQLQVG